jgi:hypothetical protein
MTKKRAFWISVAVLSFGMIGTLLAVILFFLLWPPLAF